MAKVQMGGATVNGRRPAIKVDIHDYGTSGTARKAGLKSSMVGNEGATDPGTGRKLEPKPSTPPLAGSAEVQTRGTTAEEMKKKLAASMYPSSRGTRDYLRT